jgi:hypothetical protein
MLSAAPTDKEIARQNQSRGRAACRGWFTAAALTYG